MIFNAKMLHPQFVTETIPLFISLIMKSYNKWTLIHIWNSQYQRTHITNLTKNANSALGFLRRNLKYCSEDSKRLAYISLVNSTLEYDAVVWDPYHSRDIIAVEIVQKQTARFIKNDYKSRFEGCVTSMLEDLMLPTLQQRRLVSRLVMLYKVVRGMVPAINAGTSNQC